MNEFSIIAEDGITLEDLRELIRKTEKYDGNTPVILGYSNEDKPYAKEIMVIENDSITLYNYC